MSDYINFDYDSDRYSISSYGSYITSYDLDIIEKINYINNILNETQKTIDTNNQLIHKFKLLDDYEF